MDLRASLDEVFRDRTKMIELVARDAQRFFRDRASPADLECWSRDAVDELWRDDVRVTEFIPTLALRRVRERVAAAERDRNLISTSFAA
jgi:hypothetical protein